MQEAELKKENPIAILDSGLGGISVLREMLRVMPSEHYLYFGDSVNAPYGEKPAELIVDICRGHINRFLKQGIKCVVLACNTATSAAAPTLREEYRGLPIIGMEPAVKLAAEQGKNQRILVLATPLTIHGNRLHHLVEVHGGDTEFILREAPGIVRLVEAGVCDANPKEELLEYLASLLSEFRPDKDGKILTKLDGVVLGCTHFPFVRESIRKTLGYPVSVYDGAHGTALQTRRILLEEGLLRETGEASVSLDNSDKTKLETERLLLELPRKD